MRKPAVHRAIIVYPEIKAKFKLSSDQYMVLEAIRIFSTIRPEYAWCFAGKEWLAEYCKVSRQTIYRAIARGKEAGLIESCPDDTQQIRTTSKWNDLVLGLSEIRGQSQIVTERNIADKLKEMLSQSGIEASQSGTQNKGSNTGESSNKIHTHFSHILKSFEEQMSSSDNLRREFDTWFRPLTLLRIDNHTAVIGVPDEAFQFWLDANYRKEFQSAFQKEFQEILEITFQIEAEAERTP